MFTLDEMKQIMPSLPRPKAVGYIEYLIAAMVEFEINTPVRVAAFLAQLAHESGELRYFEEIASGAAYESRRDLGNTVAGDGVRYKGRGPIQITGRNNYRAAGIALGVDLETYPKRAADLDIAFRTAGWFWQSRGLNSLADKGTDEAFRIITKRINGGLNGLASRLNYYKKALQVLGVS